MITKELEDLVVEEATNLRIHATNEEKSNLNLNQLVYSSPTNCIYGLMTGHCFEERAVELIDKCCQKVYKVEGELEIRDLPLNGSPAGKERNRVKCEYYSPIEVLLDNEGWRATSKESSIAKVIQFIKGEINELNF